MKKGQIFKLLILAVAFSLAFLPLPALATGSATLSLSPSSGAFNVNDTFSVEIRLNTGGEAINTVKAYLDYPTAKLEAQRVSITGSFCTMWVENDITTAGLVKLVGGLPTPGFTGTNGLFATVTFRTKAAGTVAITFNSASRVRRNSDSVDILDLSASTAGSYTVSSAIGGPEPTPTPTPTATPTPTTPAPTPTPTTAEPELPDTASTTLTINILLGALGLIFISLLGLFFTRTRKIPLR